MKKLIVKPETFLLRLQHQKVFLSLIYSDIKSNCSSLFSYFLEGIAGGLAKRNQIESIGTIASYLGLNSLCGYLCSRSRLQSLEGFLEGALSEALAMC